VALFTEHLPSTKIVDDVGQKPSNDRSIHAHFTSPGNQDGGFVQSMSVYTGVTQFYIRQRSDCKKTENWEAHLGLVQQVAALLQLEVLLPDYGLHKQP